MLLLPARPPDAETAAAIVAAARPGAYRFGIVLGSGLGALADAATDAVRVPYRVLPGFPEGGVSAHRYELVAGLLAGVPVVVLAGRAHTYEHGDPAAMKVPLATLAALGCKAVILTNAAGSLHPEMGPGSLMRIADHINFAGRNPLIGEAGDARFVGLTRAYDETLAAAFDAAAAAEGIAVAAGVYMWFSGPSFETPAEIRMARTLGADAVGMSTVPEVILARFFGLDVLAVSSITNFAAGMTGGELSHQDTKDMAPMGAQKLVRILTRMIGDLNYG